MGNVVSNTASCFTQRSKEKHSEEDFLKECYFKKDQNLELKNQQEKNNAEPKTALLEKSQNPSVLENGWSSGAGSLKSLQNKGLVKQNNLDQKQLNSRGNKVQKEIQPNWALQTGTVQRHSGCRQFSTREVTEVTEVTETVVTEIIEVTEYPHGEKGGNPVVTRTVKVLTECAGELAEVDILYILQYTVMWYLIFKCYTEGSAYLIYIKSIMS
ncbi:uncharacterized protein LOC122797774 [Protopterus annectens]|uniref:uncharacterized protein LOC122797774 n=1 Tax=Protopterus annectens TaxID=7888 RepID=UPI001CFC4482|nr:uncharacterized protein LOC122797774 [Protopterus annectens]